MFIFRSLADHMIRVAELMAGGIDQVTDLTPDNVSVLRDLRRDLDLTYLFISHDLAVVEQLCDDVVVTKEGRVVEDGRGEAVFRSPTADYTRTLIEAAPALCRLPDAPQPWASRADEGVNEQRGPQEQSFGERCRPGVLQEPYTAAVSTKRGPRDGRQGYGLRFPVGGRTK